MFLETCCYNRINIRYKLLSMILGACWPHFFQWLKWRFGAVISYVLKTPLVLIIFVFHSIISENIIKGDLVVIQKWRSRNQRKVKEHQKNYRLFTKHDTASKYRDITRTLVITDHLSSMSSRHASTPQFKYNYWTNFSIQKEIFTVTKFCV